MSVADPGLHGPLTAAVGKVEGRSAAEVVVVLAPRSETYRDLAYLWGALACAAVLAFAVFSPFDFREAWLVFELPVLFLAVSWVARRTPWLLRLGLGAERRDHSVTRAARAAFVEEALTGTRDRSGILYYYSALEDRLRILPDAGILGKTGEAAFHRVVHEFEADRRPLAERLVAAIEAPADLLAEHLPRRSDDVNELDDAPRVRADAR